MGNRKRVNCQTTTTGLVKEKTEKKDKPKIRPTRTVTPWNLGHKEDCGRQMAAVGKLGDASGPDPNGFLLASESMPM
jgi:hypothetical protein